MSEIIVDLPELDPSIEYPEIAWGVSKPGIDVHPMTIPRPKVGDFDVKIKMEYCGICHSDIHLASNDLGGSIYPMVTGHELIGRVEEIGS